LLDNPKLPLLFEVERRDCGPGRAQDCRYHLLKFLLGPLNPICKSFTTVDFLAANCLQIYHTSFLVRGKLKSEPATTSPTYHILQCVQKAQDERWMALLSVATISRSVTLRPTIAPIQLAQRTMETLGRDKSSGHRGAEENASFCSIE
jgi:hypothetical protein